MPVITKTQLTQTQISKSTAVVLFGLNRKFAAERKTDNNPLQGIKDTFGSLKDELFSDDYWDDDPWDNQMNRNYRNSRYGNSRDDDPWDNDYFL